MNDYLSDALNVFQKKMLVQYFYNKKLPYENI